MLFRSNRSSDPVSLRLGLLWEHCLGRPASEDEQKMIQQLYDGLVFESRGENEGRVDEAHIWVVVARTLMNLDEMVTRP